MFQGQDSQVGNIGLTLVPTIGNHELTDKYHAWWWPQNKLLKRIIAITTRTISFSICREQCFIVLLHV